VNNSEFKVKSTLLLGDINGIRSAVYEFESLISSTKSFDDESVANVIRLIDCSMAKDALGANVLINLFQSHWSKLSDKSHSEVLSMCNRHIDNSKCLGAQTAICEILNGEYLQ
jgi:hypothetical protein